MVTKLTFDRKYLLQWMSAIANSFIFSGQLHEIFKCVKFEVEFSPTERIVSLWGADGTSNVHIKNMECDISVGDVSGLVSFALPAETLLKILSASDKKNIDFTIDGESIVIKTEGRYSLSNTDTDTFPDFPPIDCEFQSFENFNFVKVMDKLTPFAAKDLAKPQLAGVAVAENMYISSVGTHGASHPRIENALGQACLSLYAIKFLNSMEISKLDNIQFGLTDSMFIIKSDQFIYTSTLPVDPFPFESFANVMASTSQFAFKYLVNGGELLSAIKRVLLLDSDKFTALNLVFSRESLKLSCESAMTASSSVEVIGVVEIRLPEGAQFQSIEIKLGVQSVDAFRRLFEDVEMPIMFTYIADRKPIFINQRGSKFTFYTTTQRLG